MQQHDTEKDPLQLLTLWIGPRLSFVERACLKSALREGHRVALYCYARPEGVPDGVELRDAASVLPEQAIVRHRSGSPALFANRFRYELLRRGLGTWTDCDMYFVSPLDDPGGWLFGDQGGGTLNTAVLRLPSDSAVLTGLLQLFDETSVPPWLAPRERLRAWLRFALSGRCDLTRLPWGSAGPEALTWLASKHGVAHHAQPVSRFYPVPWTEAAWLLDPGRPLESVISADTIAIHLWHERLRGLDLADPPPGSFAGRLVAEGQGDD